MIFNLDIYFQDKIVKLKILQACLAVILYFMPYNIFNFYLDACINRIHCNSIMLCNCDKISIYLIGER